MDSIFSQETARETWVVACSKTVLEEDLRADNHSLVDFRYFLRHGNSSLLTNLTTSLETKPNSHQKSVSFNFFLLFLNHSGSRFLDTCLRVTFWIWKLAMSRSGERFKENHLSLLFLKHNGYIWAKISQSLEWSTH